MKSLFKSEKGRKEVLELYDQKLAELQIDYEYRQIETDFGTTNIIVSGDASKPPLVLIHGSNGCAPIAFETYPNLTKKYQVFALDVLAQPNKSAENRLSMKGNSYGKWVHDVINQLELKDVKLAGFSFGGLIILKTLLHDQSNIKEVFLAAPAFIVNGNPLVSLFKVFIPMKRYMKRQNKKHLEKFLGALFTQKDEFALKYLSKVFLHFEMDFTPIPTIKKEEARSIQTPITLFAAGQDIMFPGAKMLKRSSKIFPSLKKSVMLGNSKHVQNRSDNDKIEELILGG